MEVLLVREMHFTEQLSCALLANHLDLTVNVVFSSFLSLFSLGSLFHVMLIVDSEREIERERESFHAVGTTNLEEKCFCLIGG